MTSATPLTALRSTDPAPDAGPQAPARQASSASGVQAGLSLSLYQRLDAIEAEWRRFEQVADCTAFQTFDWLTAWQRHIGSRDGVRPAIAHATYGNGTTALILPLAVEPHRSARRLCWLGQDLNDYNAPLLARDYSDRVAADLFVALWAELCARLQSEPMLRHDWIELEKMPETVGGQRNPFFHLGVAANPSGAHFTLLGGDWKQLYADKRSSATRRRDRTKLKHMSAFGDIRFITSADRDDAERTLRTLIEQKHRQFAQKGITDMFARPGWREFFLDIAARLPAGGAAAQAADDRSTSPPLQAGPNGTALHVSRVQIGATCAAANLGIIFGDTYYHMLASYDDGELARYGPGALHLRELLAYAIGCGLRRFDFTIGDEPYKLEWSDVQVKLGDYARPSTWRGVAVWCGSTLRRPVKRFLKQTPWAWRAVTCFRTAIGQMLQRRQTLPPRPRKAAAASSSRPPMACVMGDMDLLRPIAAAGIRCGIVARPGVPSLYSRFAQLRLPCHDFAENADPLVEQLIRFGKAQSVPPVLFYEEDFQLALISRHRERLAQAFRFVIADAPSVEDLLDKARFQALAARHGLPVPPARRFRAADTHPGLLDLRFPVVVKPLTRLAHWNDKVGLRKALAAENREALCALWPQLVELGIELLAQQLIAGPEAQIESYHCYIDRSGSIAGEFTGRKIRTSPTAFGHTSALEIIAGADVQRQGRAIAERLGLTGVAKFDFKRDRDGKLHLLEINPRFTLWHHAGAVAGVNIPAMVFADLTGTPRPQPGSARAGVRWCRPWTDFAAAREMGMPLAQWLSWIWHCEAKSSLSWDDPMPLLRSALYRLVVRPMAQIRAGTPQARQRIGP